MKKAVVLLTIFVLLSVMTLGFTLEIGGGVNMISFLGVAIPLPTAAVGVGIPIVGDFSLTGQFDVILPISSSDESTMAFMILGGGRYTFKTNNMNVFFGADGGILTSSEIVSNSTPIFGVNAGVNFSIFYVKAAMRWMSISSNQEVSHPVTMFIPLTELTAGLGFNF